MRPLRYSYALGSTPPRSLLLYASYAAYADRYLPAAQLALVTASSHKACHIALRY
jgi:hypothetical protein